MPNVKYARKRLHILSIAPRTPPEAPDRPSKLGVAKGSQALPTAPNARQRPHSPQDVHRRPQATLADATRRSQTPETDAPQRPEMVPPPNRPVRPWVSLQSLACLDQDDN